VPQKYAKFSPTQKSALTFAKIFVYLCSRPIATIITMEKVKFVAEYELRASPKMLFPYISTASGLSQWFASKVNTMPDQRFDFQWDNESHIARQVSMRQNKGVRFEFLDTAENGHDNNYVEFRVDQSELTQSTYLRVTDYSTTSDKEELKDLWDGLMDKLKEIVGS
jgi:uncharacterized protein YndB with AHSA1/START domain